MKKILYNTDFSNCSINAFIYALHLANKFNAEIITLHTYMRPVIGSLYLPNTYRNIFEHLQNNEFDMFKDTSKVMYEIAKKNNLEHIKNTFLLVEDDTIDGMLNTIEQESIDLVVMGTKGASGLKEIFIGSTTNKLIKQSNCPVLAIPEGSKYGDGIKNILFNSDFFPKEITSLKYALDLSDNLCAHLECINTAIDYDDYKEKTIANWKEKLQFTKYKNLSLSIADATNLNEISTYITNNDIDLIVSTSYGNNFFEELFHYSLTKQLVHHSKIPILTIPNNYTKKSI